MEIFRRFKMEDYRLMATHMVTNLKKVVTSNLEFVDPKVYKKPTRSLMYLVNARLGICFSMNTSS